MNINKALILIIAGSLLLSACTTQDAYTGDRKVNRASKYGLVGAVVCGAIGATESSKRARNAAAACGLVGIDEVEFIYGPDGHLTGAR